MIGVNASTPKDPRFVIEGPPCISSSSRSSLLAGRALSEVT